jgi:hypothetical protein
MHATPRHSFCFPLYLVAPYHFLVCFSPTMSTHSHFLASLVFLAWLHAFPGPIDLRKSASTWTTYLDSDRLPDCIAWRWHLF